jgi:hypothetical protein
MVVKRTHDRTEIYRLGHVRLYRDDLEQIAKAVAEVGPLKIACPPWELTDPSDFANPDLPERLPELTMTAEHGGTDAKVEVSLGREVAEVTLTEPVTLTLGVLNRIQQVCHQRWWRWWIGRLRIGDWVATLAIVFPGVLVMIFDLSGIDLLDHAMLVFGGLILGALMISLLAWTKNSSVSRKAVLINAYRADRPSFWQRSRDDWVIGVVMLLLGGMLGYLVNQIT